MKYNVGDIVLVTAIWRVHPYLGIIHKAHTVVGILPYTVRVLDAMDEVLYGYLTDYKEDEFSLYCPAV